MSNHHDVTVIIATTGESARKDSLENSIQSINQQANVLTKPLVFLNGKKYDQKVYSSLVNNPWIEFHYSEKPSLPNAIHEARKLVRTPYFCFLDDDDTLIKDTLLDRLTPLISDSNIDAVISNGLHKTKNNTNTSFIKYLPKNSEEPLEKLMTSNWLASCGGLYRSSSINEDYFDPHQKYYEWTYVAFKLASSKNLFFLDKPTFIINESEESLSHSENYIKELPIFLTRLRNETANPPHIKSTLSKRIAKAHNLVANFYLERADFKNALKHHVACTFSSVYGLRYQAWLYHYFKKYLIK